MPNSCWGDCRDDAPKYFWAVFNFLNIRTRVDIHNMLKIILTICLGNLLVCMSGCNGASGLDVEGTISLDGDPLDLEGARRVKVALLPREESGPEATQEPLQLVAEVAEDGTFSLQNVRPGEYRVVVSDFTRFPFDDRLANYFREHPDALAVIVEEGKSLDIVVRKEWYQSQRANSRRR